MKEILGKICLLGDSDVGKASLVRRFVYKRFDEKYDSTPGTILSKKMLPFYSPESNIELQLLIRDIGGLRGLKKIPGVTRGEG